jgi:UDP-GlcNAc:undecaprenyl-phosphate GlcNAc-1-phosphate transferase
MGHSHRQSVLLMYLWAALFSGIVVGLSVIRTQLVWPGVVTLVALIALLLATIPQWRPWWRERRAGQGAQAPAAEPQQPAADPPVIPGAAPAIGHVAPDGPAANGHSPSGTHVTDEPANGWPARDFPVPPTSWRH